MLSTHLCALISQFCTHIILMAFMLGFSLQGDFLQQRKGQRGPISNGPGNAWSLWAVTITLGGPRKEGALFLSCEVGTVKIWDCWDSVFSPFLLWCLTVSSLILGKKEFIHLRLPDIFSTFSHTVNTLRPAVYKIRSMNGNKKFFLHFEPKIWFK